MAMEESKPAAIPAALAAIAALPPGARVLVQGCASASGLTASAVRAAGDALPAITFTGVQVPGVNRDSWLANPASRFTTFFMTPELKRADSQVEFLPLCYAEIRAHLASTRIDAALLAVSPPNPEGRCSFGPTVDFLADLWPRIPLRIAHINPCIPDCGEPTAVPLAELTHTFEAEEPLRELADAPSDEVSSTIATFCASLIPNNATVQTGLGKLPGAILRALDGHSGIRIHSGLIGDPVLDLIERGVINSGHQVIAGVAIGTRRLYDALPASGIRMRPVSVTHDPAVLSTLDNLVTINSAMEVDLYGQAFAEAGPAGWNSGPGGASDFARGALTAGGTRIIVLPARAGQASRIVAPGAGRGPVSLSRSDIDIVVTEHGIAHLKGRSHDQRAAALIAIASPDHREHLARQWRDGPASF